MKKRMYLVSCDKTDFGIVYCSTLEEACDVIKGDQDSLTDKDISDEDDTAEYCILLKIMTDEEINDLPEYSG